MPRKPRTPKAAQTLKDGVSSALQPAIEQAGGVQSAVPAAASVATPAVEAPLSDLDKLLLEKNVLPETLKNLSEDQKQAVLVFHHAARHEGKGPNGESVEEIANQLNPTEIPGVQKALKEIGGSQPASGSPTVRTGSASDASSGTPDERGRPTGVRYVERVERYTQEHGINRIADHISEVTGIPADKVKGKLVQVADGITKSTARPDQVADELQKAAEELQKALRTSKESIGGFKILLGDTKDGLTLKQYNALAKTIELSAADPGKNVPVSFAQYLGDPDAANLFPQGTRVYVQDATTGKRLLKENLLDIKFRQYLPPGAIDLPNAEPAIQEAVRRLEAVANLGDRNLTITDLSTAAKQVSRNLSAGTSRQKNTINQLVADVGLPTSETAAARVTPGNWEGTFRDLTNAPKGSIYEGMRPDAARQTIQEVFSTRLGPTARVVTRPAAPLTEAEKSTRWLNDLMGWTEQEQVLADPAAVTAARAEEGARRAGLDRPYPAMDASMAQQGVYRDLHTKNYPLARREDIVTGTRLVDESIEKGKQAAQQAAEKVPGWLEGPGFLRKTLRGMLERPFIGGVAAGAGFEALSAAPEVAGRHLPHLFGQPNAEEAAIMSKAMQAGASYEQAAAAFGPNRTVEGARDVGAAMADRVWLQNQLASLMNRSSPGNYDPQPAPRPLTNSQKMQQAMAQGLAPGSSIL